MKYNESNGMEIEMGVVFTSKIEEESIFEVSSYVLHDVNAFNINANFGLNIIGDVKSDKIRIMGNFICQGNCVCKELYVQGSCNIQGELNAEKIFIGEKLFANNIYTDILEAKNDIICLTMECNKSVLCGGSIMATEGILGIGDVRCKLAVCGEYTTLNTVDEANIVVIDEIMNKLNVDKTKNFNVEEWINKGLVLEWEEFGQQLEKMSEEFPQYKNESMIYNNLLMYSDLSKIEDLKQYVLLFDLLFCKVEIIANCDLVNMLKEELLKKAEQNINTLELPSIDQSDFANLLKIVTTYHNIMKEEVFLYVIENLYNKIGLKYTAVEMMIGK